MKAYLQDRSLETSSISSPNTSSRLERNNEKIIRLSDERARRVVPTASKHPSLTLHDNLPNFLDHLIHSLKPENLESEACLDEACKEHGRQRAPTTPAWAGKNEGRSNSKDQIKRDIFMTNRKNPTPKNEHTQRPKEKNQE